MKKRAKHAPKSLSSSEISIRVVIAGVVLLLLFLVALFLNHWYLYSHFNTPEKTIATSPEESPSSLPAQKDALSKGEEDTSLTFYDRLTRQEPQDAHELSPPPPSHDVASSPSTSTPQFPLPRDQTNLPTNLTSKSVPEMQENITEELSYTVQVGSFQSLESAEKILALLNHQGFDASITSVNLSGDKTWYRVRIGKFPIREDADKVAQQLKENGTFQPLIMPLRNPNEGVP